MSDEGRRRNTWSVVLLPLTSHKRRLVMSNSLRYVTDAFVAERLFPRLKVFPALTGFK